MSIARRSGHYAFMRPWQSLLLAALIVPTSACSSSASHNAAPASSTASPSTHNAVGPASTVSPSTPTTSTTFSVLHLSVTSGRVGTRITMTATNCPPVQGQSQSVFWHNAYNVRHPAEAGPRGLVALKRHQVGASRVESAYVVGRSDPLGRSVVVVECGGRVGNAVRYFTVTR